VYFEGRWGRAFLTEYSSASDGERLRMAEGLGKGAGLTLLAIPIAEAFKFTQAQFQRILSNFLSLEGAIGVPLTNHCGGGVTRTATNGGTFDANVVFFDPSLRARIILEVSIVTIGSDMGEAHEPAWMGSTRSCERARRKSATTALSGGCLTRREIRLLKPHRDPMVAFLKEVYSRAMEADKLFMSQHPALHTWNTAMASSFWGMRLSIACAATDADYQNRIIILDNTLNLPVVARQPHLDPNYAPRAAAHGVTA